MWIRLKRERQLHFDCEKGKINLQSLTVPVDISPVDDVVKIDYVHKVCIILL